ncbi:MAG TPA: HET domain-containing protein [Polyangiaceae bacterium]
MDLLVRNSVATRRSTLRANGQVWTLERFERSTAPSYTCVSYAWGVGQSDHPFAPGKFISDRAQAALDAAARFTKTDGLWIDAFCVPPDEPERSATLRQLGSIYAGADEVLVVLSASARALFDACEAGRRVDMDALRALEEERWIGRFWTYQELALAKQLRFILQNDSSFALPGEEFLNKVGEPLARAKPTELAELRALDNLNDVLASWIHGGAQPFAYQIMSGLASRTAERPADRFNAILGALDPSGAFATSADVKEASEQFMATCEAKGDLSFIYATGARSTLPGRSWRPQAGELLPLLAWHTFGNGQTGSVHKTHAELENLRLVRRGPPAEDARDFIDEWLSQIGTPRNGEPLASAVAKALAAMGAQHLDPAIELERGLFFPAQTQEPDAAHAILVATELRWVHGSPALLVEPLPKGRYRCVGVGIFIGPTGPGETVEIE